MTTYTPTVSVVHEQKALAVDAPEKAILWAPLGAGALGVADVPTALVDQDQGAAHFGDGQGRDAVRHWFELQRAVPALRDVQLLMMGFTLTGTPSTRTITLTGPSTGAGTWWVRLGDFVIPVAVADATSADDQAAAIDAAVNASAAPWTSTVLTNVVTLTTDYDGEESLRYHVSVNFESDRGELAVPGSTAVVGAAAAGTGAAVALTTAQKTAIADSGAQWFIHGQTAGVFAASLKAELVTGWDTRNQYMHAIQAYSSDDGVEATVTAISSLLGDIRSVFMAVANGPMFELQAAMSLLAAVIDNPRDGLIGLELPAMVPPTIKLDSETLGQGGAMVAHRAADDGTIARAVRTTTANWNPGDLRQLDLATGLKQRELGERFVAYGKSILGSTIIKDGIAPSGEVSRPITEDEADVGAGEIMAQAARDGIVYGTEDEARAMLLSTDLLESGGTIQGFKFTVDTIWTPIVAQVQATISS